MLSYTFLLPISLDIVSTDQTTRFIKFMKLNASMIKNHLIESEEKFDLFIQPWDFCSDEDYMCCFIKTKCIYIFICCYIYLVWFHNEWPDQYNCISIIGRSNQIYFAVNQSNFISNSTRVTFDMAGVLSRCTVNNILDAFAQVVWWFDEWTWI